MITEIKTKTYCKLIGGPWDGEIFDMVRWPLRLDLEDFYIMEGEKGPKAMTARATYTIEGDDQHVMTPEGWRPWDEIFLIISLPCSFEEIKEICVDALPISNREGKAFIPLNVHYKHVI